MLVFNLEVCEMWTLWSGNFHLKTKLPLAKKAQTTIVTNLWNVQIKAYIFSRRLLQKNTKILQSQNFLQLATFYTV